MIKTPARLHHKNLNIPSRPALLLGLAVAGYVLVISLLHYYRLTHFMNGFDLAFYQQAIWNTGQGRFLEVSATDFSSSLLGTDVLLIYALMAPFYAVAPSPMTLLALETIIVGLGALPVYWLARERLGNGWPALGFALVYLLLPAVQNGNLYELRERPMAGAFLLFAFWAWQRGRLGLFGLAAGLALACRPENGLALAMLGLYGLVMGYQRRPERGWRFIAVPAGLGLAWFGAALLVIQAAGGGRFALGSTFAGGSPLAAVTTLLVDPARGWRQLFETEAMLAGKLLYLPLLLLPLAFLPLLEPRPLLMALPPAGLNLLAGPRRELQWNPFDYHYQGSVVPWLLVAAILGVERVAAGRPAGSARPPKTAALLVGLALALTVTTNIFTNLAVYDTPGLPRVKHGWGPVLRTRENPRWAEGRELLKRIPDDAPLAVTNLWAVQVRPRRGLWLFAERELYSRQPARAARLVLADIRDPASEEAGDVRELLAGGQWREVEQRAGYILLERVG